MTILKRTELNTLSLILVLIVASMLIGYSFLKYQFYISIDEQLEENYKSVEKLFTAKVEKEKEKFKLELNNIVLLPSLSKAVADRDNKQLETIIAKYYINLKQVYPDIEILTFRSSDGTTLYRAHKPEIYGDKVNKKRELILDTDKFKKSFSGFEVGKFEMTYRVTQPIFYKNMYVGNVEIGLAPKYFLNELSTIFSMHIGVSIKKDLLNIMLNPQSTLIDENNVLLVADEKLKSYFSQNKQQLFGFLFDDYSLKVKNDISFVNHNRQVIGHLVIGFDREKIIKRNNLFIYRFFGFILIMMIISGFVLNKGFQKILNFFTAQIYIDQVTGLKNRVALNDLLHLNKSHVLILSDIKDFSIINELYGVEVGNKVLQQTAIAFDDFAIKNGFNVFRISSDEYILYKEEKFFDEDDYIDILESLHKMINTLEISIDGIYETIRIDINSGIVFDTVDSLEKAQMALKKAKKSTSSYMAYSKGVDTKEKSETILQIKKSIIHGLKDQNVIPFFQPITDNTGKITKYEALIRILTYEDGVKKIIAPDSFIEISKKNGFYTEISKRMLEKSLSFFKNRDERISINMSPGDLFNTDIMDVLIANIKKYDTPSRIVVEITEQDSVEDFERFVHGIKILRRLGVLIAIDDFGSGYANYAHILVIKPDYLKIDGTLISEIMTKNDIRILVKSIIAFAKELNIKTIAEYTENKEIFELLKEYGADEFQGYYFGKPLDLINEESQKNKNL
jgi:EAL domain-containing protein (putative c-di-GMP-specific phosphodiesterase class I)